MTLRPKTILTICAMYITMSRATAQADSATYLATPQNCKFINNKTELVINNHLTVPVYGIDTIYDDRHQMRIICHSDNNIKYVFNPKYYKIPWLPVSAKQDSIVFKYALEDIRWTKLYYIAEENGDEQNRKYAEEQILNARRKAFERLDELEQERQEKIRLLLRAIFSLDRLL